MHKLKKDILQFTKLSKIPGLIHGFSTRQFGSMRPDYPSLEESLQKFSQSLGIDQDNIIKMHQTHSNNIRWVKPDQAGQRISETDGIFTKETDIFLSVMSADCVPILFYDRQKNYVGAVHAGWRGIYNEILKMAVKELRSNGSDPADLLIGIGPCIRSCCYNISEERAELFYKKFSSYTTGVKIRKKMIYLDLPEMAKQQLTSEGVPIENIEDCDICTFDNTDKFFSYRKEGKNFGEFIGIIGLSSEV